mgnify:CR=1 FL=1
MLLILYAFANVSSECLHRSKNIHFIFGECGFVHPCLRWGGFACGFGLLSIAFAVKELFPTKEKYNKTEPAYVKHRKDTIKNENKIN